MSMRKQKGETAEMKFIGGILNKYITVYLSVPALRMARSLALGKGIRVNAGSLCLCFFVAQLTKEATCILTCTY